MAEQDPTASVFEEQRSYLFSIAYRLLGSVSDAEDIVQDAFLRWDREPLPDLRSPRAYLTTIVVRLCLDQLRSARAKREIYVGPWLPEPLITTGRTDLTDSLVLRESLSFAFLLMLENLSPLERAVLVLDHPGHALAAHRSQLPPGVSPSAATPRPTAIQVRGDARADGADHSRVHAGDHKRRRSGSLALAGGRRGGHL